MRGITMTRDVDGRGRAEQRRPAPSGSAIYCGDHSECEIKHNVVVGTRSDAASGDRRARGDGIVAHYGAEAELDRNVLVATTRRRSASSSTRSSTGSAEMKPNRSIPTATVIPVLIYPDVREAVAWLSAAFGFVERLQIGEDHRSQLSFGDGAVIVGDVRHDRRPPRPGEVTHSVMVRVDDAHAHCERARAHGAAS